MRRLDSGGSSHGDDLLTCLCDLFHTISTQRKRCGVHPPRKFIAKLREENEVFNNHMHQDAHEFLNYLLNEAAEILEKRNKTTNAAGNAGSSSSAAKASGSGSAGASVAAGADSGGEDEETEDDGSCAEDGERPGGHGASSTVEGRGPSSSGDKGADGKTWIHTIFEGLLTNETRCLACDTVTSRDESFLDLSLEIEQNSSVSACMRNFSANEALRGDNKFFCDTCCSLQEAQKRMRIKRLPNVLALHLKRFKCAPFRATPRPFAPRSPTCVSSTDPAYDPASARFARRYMEHLQRFKKLSYRIAFPLELKLTNVCDEAADPDRKYRLFAVIVHAGSGPNHGHYVALVRAHNQWLCFDDDVIEPIDEAQIQSYFGTSTDTAASTETGYLLFYEAASS